MSESANQQLIEVAELQARLSAVFAERDEACAARDEALSQAIACSNSCVNCSMKVLT